MRGPGGVHRLLKKGLREFLAHTLLHKNDLVCEQTHKPSDPAFSHLSKAPYWSTARVCYWPRQWERRDGKDGYWNMCCVHPASWINTAHLPHTHLPLYSPHWWSDWITTPLFYVLSRIDESPPFLTGAVGRVSDWLRWQEGGAFSLQCVTLTDPEMRYSCTSELVMCVLWICDCVYVCVRLTRLWSDSRPSLSCVRWTFLTESSIMKLNISTFFVYF